MELDGSGRGGFLSGLLFAACVIFPGSSSVMAQAFPDSVLEFVPGRNAGFGSDFFPDNVLGAPHGTSDPSTPNFSENDLVSLGTGGSIILEFSTNWIVDGPGADLTIFENPVQPLGHPEQTFADAAVVAVSMDGVEWRVFDFDMVSSSPLLVDEKSNYVGFAGVMPSLSSPENGVSPFDPAVSGGDQFDLADVGLAWARFVRITDSGDERFLPQYDVQGDVVTDYGNMLDPDPTRTGLGVSAGFDLDAVAGIHTEAWGTAGVAEWLLYD